MTRLIAGEFLKLRTTRTFYGFLAAIVVLTLLVVILTLAFLDPNDVSDEEIEGLLTTGSLVGILILVLGVIGMSGEQRHNTISSTLLVAPDRLSIIGAKALAYALAGVVLAAAAFLLTAVIVFPTLAALDVDTGLDGGRIAELFFRGLLYAAISGALGVGVGAVVSNQVAAVLGVVIVLFVVDPLLIGLAPDVGSYTVNASGFALAGGDDGEDAGELLSAVAGGLVYLGWALAFLGAGAPILARRDVV